MTALAGESTYRNEYIYRGISGRVTHGSADWRDQLTAVNGVGRTCGAVCITWTGETALEVSDDQQGKEMDLLCSCADSCY